MDSAWSELLNLVLRWAHVFAAILWIGSTWYFTWLDRRFGDETQNPGGQVWMVHSGGFYVVEKRKAPELGSRKLHWFRWEAMFTWLSGMCLFVLIYYHGGMLLPYESTMSQGTAIAISIGLLIAGWAVYDLLWMSPIGKNEPLGAAISYMLIVATGYGLFQVFSARGAFLQLGAMLGTIMANNVAMRIVPAQRRMVAATAAGGQPDPTEAARAKGRSKHNSFIVLPVLLMMLSSHFPTLTYGHRYPWVVIAIVVAVGWVSAKVLREH